MDLNRRFYLRDDQRDDQPAPKADHGDTDRSGGCATLLIPVSLIAWIAAAGVVAGLLK